MIYAVFINEGFAGNDVYRLFETTTESHFEASTKMIINSNLEVSNLNIVEDKVTVQPHWDIYKSNTNKITGARHILLCKITENKYKLVNHKGDVIHCDSDSLNQIRQRNAIANYKPKSQEFGTYNITPDIKFVQDIAKKYQLYEAKSALLGRKMSFDYMIEGTTVKLKKYTSTTKDVIIPKFVTSIMVKAFDNCKIETLTLEEGLGAIGAYSFRDCTIAEVVLPKTVNFVFQGAFHRSTKIFTENPKVLILE